MRPNPVKQKLLRDELTIGLMLLGADLHIPGIAAEAGFDFIMADQEHTSLTLRELEVLVRASDAAGISALSRVASCEKSDILAVLETGVKGIMVPAVETVEEAQSVVNAARYAPAGKRGMYYLGYGSRYCGVPPAEYFPACNEELLILIQIETVKGVERAAEIAAVPGVDCLFIGPADLTQSLGVPWEFEHPALWEAVDKTFHATRLAGKIAGIMPAGADYARRCEEKGARMMLWGPDLALMQRAAREDVSTLAKTLRWKPNLPQA